VSKPFQARIFLLQPIQDDLQSLTRASTTSTLKISKRQICLMFGLMGTAFNAINEVQKNNSQKQILRKNELGCKRQLR
jgi:hypothetical protein